MSSSDAHYAGGLVDGACILHVAVVPLDKQRAR